MPCLQPVGLVRSTSWRFGRDTATQQQHASGKGSDDGIRVTLCWPHWGSVDFWQSKFRSRESFGMVGLNFDLKKRANETTTAQQHLSLEFRANFKRDLKKKSHTEEAPRDYDCVRCIRRQLFSTRKSQAAAAAHTASCAWPVNQWPACLERW